MGEEADFDDELALLDTSKFLHISEEEMQAYVPTMVLPLGEVTAGESISSIFLNYFTIELGRYFNTSFESLLEEWLPIVRLRLSPILRR